MRRFRHPPLTFLLPTLLLACSGPEGVAREALEAQGLAVASLAPTGEEGAFSFTATRGQEDCSGTVQVRPGDDPTTATLTMDCLPPPGPTTLALPAGVPLEIVARARHCDGGEGDACAALGQAWAGGQGVAKDKERARVLFSQACAAQSGLGCYELARATGGTREQAPQPAIDLFVQACDLGHAKACGEAARQIYNIDQPSPRLVRMARQGCEADEPQACLVLGVLFANGIQVPMDMEEARRKLLQACSGGLKPACGLLEAL